MYTNIKAIHNDIVFQFDQVSRRVRAGSNESQAFQETTEWGFEFHSFDETTNMPRWGYIVAVGPKADPELVPGMHILVEALKWTNHTVHEDQKYWKTTDKHILAVEES